jgi:hypothetical protein
LITRKAYRIKSVLILSALTCTLSAHATDRDTLADDRAHRDLAIHWPKAYDPSVASVFSHNELLLHTDCHRAFTSLADAPNWANWFILTKDVSIEDADKTVHQGTLLRLKIFNSPIQSRISEFVPDSRISWIPFGADETETRHGHYHAWHSPSPPVAASSPKRPASAPTTSRTRSSTAASCTEPTTSGSPPSAGRPNSESQGKERQRLYETIATDNPSWRKHLSQALF